MNSRADWKLSKLINLTQMQILIQLKKPMNNNRAVSEFMSSCRFTSNVRSVRQSARAVPVRMLSFGRLHPLHLPRKTRPTRPTALVPKERRHEHRRYHCIDGPVQQFLFCFLSVLVWLCLILNITDIDRCAVLIDIDRYCLSSWGPSPRRCARLSGSSNFLP